MPEETWIAGSVGPVSASRSSAFPGRTAPRAGAKHWCLLAGPSFVLFETQTARTTLEACARVMRQFPQTAFVLSVAVVQRGETVAGCPLEQPVGNWPAEPPHLRPGDHRTVALGPSGLAGRSKNGLTRLTDRPIIVQPQTPGSPKTGGSPDDLPLCSPEYFTEYAKRLPFHRGNGGWAAVVASHRSISGRWRRRVKPSSRRPPGERPC